MTTNRMAIPALLACTVGLTGCTSPVAAEVTLTPITVERSIHDGSDPAATDQLPPMTLTSDHVRGLWGFSAGSWFHLDASAELVDDFLLDVTDNGTWTITAISAAEPERLLVGTVWSDGGHFGDILVLDTASKTTEVGIHRENAIGDLEAVGDDVVFISYDASDEETFTVRRGDLGTGEDRILVELPGSGRTANLAIDDTGTTYVATADRLTTLGPDGAILATVDREFASSQLAVGPTGRLVWVDGDLSGPPASVVVSGGSIDARAAITDGAGCGDGRLTFETASGPMALDVLCDSVGVAWLSAEAFVVSVGSENAASLVIVRWTDRNEN